MGMLVGIATVENDIETPQKNEKLNYHMIQQFYSWVYSQRKQKH